MKDWVIAGIIFIALTILLNFRKSVNIARDLNEIRKKRRKG